MELKITYIVSAIDRSKNITDPRYLSILLDENKQPPSSTIKAFFGKSETDYLRSIHEKYLKYHYEYVSKTLCGFRKIDFNKAEVVYLATVEYFPDINKSGEFFNIAEIQDQNILLEEYYGELFFKFGSGTFRH
jgi:hypothetical protein